MRTLSISLISLMLTSIVIANAYYQKKQFYPSVVYITKSNPSMAVSKILQLNFINLIIMTFRSFIYKLLFVCGSVGRL